MKPIFFNTEDVRATLDGRKTVTRRIVKGYIPIKAEFGYTFFTPPECISCRGTLEDKYGEKFFKLPYQPGDILYVRETWCQPAKHTFWYRSDSPVQNILWRPSIHMPKEAARIFLRVTDVRVERLQNITEEQARAEGFFNDINLTDGTGKSAVKNFAELWNRTVKPKDRDLYSWEANPWCWVIEFEKISKEEAEKRDR